MHVPPPTVSVLPNLYQLLKIILPNPRIEAPLPKHAKVAHPASHDRGRIASLAHWEPVGPANETITSPGNFLGMAAICLDRLLKQRSALRKLGTPFDFPPQRGGLRSLSVGADCFATKYRALSEL
jgi:hypothetical protein